MISWQASDGEPHDEIVRQLRDLYVAAGVPGEVLWVDYQRIAGTDDWYVAMCDWEENWWGSFYIVRWDGAEMMPATLTGEFGHFSQSIHAVSSVLLDGFDNPIVRVVDTTHQGNREVFLFELDPATGTAHCLLAGRQRLNFTWDQYDLDLTFEDVDGDGNIDAILAGEMTQQPRPNAQGEPTGTVTRVPVYKVYLWNGYDRQFELSLDYSTGVGPWDSDDTGYPDALVP